MSNTFLTPQPMQPVAAGSVVDRVIAEIRNSIVNGRFKMGQKLPNEFELMDELKVSRNSLREAMKVLAAMGIVEIRRGDGTYICSEVNSNIMDSIVYGMMLQESKTEEIVELRQILDEDVLRLAMKKCTEENLTQLQSYINQMRFYFENGEISRAAKMDYQFHIYMAQCCQNRFLLRIIEGVYGLFESSIEKNIRTEQLFAEADKHHQDMVDCLRAKDESRIPAVIAQSLSSWRANVEKGKRKDED